MSVTDDQRSTKALLKAKRQEDYRRYKDKMRKDRQRLKDEKATSRQQAKQQRAAELQKLIKPASTLDE